MSAKCCEENRFIFLSFSRKKKKKRPEKITMLLAFYVFLKLQATTRATWVDDDNDSWSSVQSNNLINYSLVIFIPWVPLILWSAYGRLQVSQDSTAWFCVDSVLFLSKFALNSRIEISRVDTLNLRKNPVTQVTVRTGLADELSVGKIWVKVGEDCREIVVRVYRGGVFVLAYVMRTYSTKYMSVFVS